MKIFKILTLFIFLFSLVGCLEVSEVKMPRNWLFWGIILISSIVFIWFLYVVIKHKFFIRHRLVVISLLGLGLIFLYFLLIKNYVDKNMTKKNIKVDSIFAEPEGTKNKINEYITKKINEKEAEENIIKDNSTRQPDLQVNGIFCEEEGQSYAIVNGEIVKVGDRIGEVEVIEISKDFVKFKYKDGVFVKKVGEGVVKEENMASFSSVPLTEDIRKQIYREILRINKSLPHGQEGNELFFQMIDGLGYKYGLTRDQLIEIEDEGARKKWYNE